MTSILYAALDDSAAGVASLARLPAMVKRLQIADCDTSVSTLRALVEGVTEPVSALILAVGNGRSDATSGEDVWVEQIHLSLRRAFGLFTGAGRRFLRDSGGAIVLLIPSTAVGPARIATPQLVLQRSIVGMAEALRAELQSTRVRVSLIFHNGSDETDADLATRLAAVLADGPMYSLSADVSAEQIEAYFAPLLAAVDGTSEGQPLPDIGPMAAVYDLEAAGAVPR